MLGIVVDVLVQFESTIVGGLHSWLYMFTAKSSISLMPLSAMPFNTFTQHTNSEAS